MTCIVGLVDGGAVYLAGDSAGVDGLSIVRRRDPKVFKLGEFVIGFTSSFRMGQLLHHSFEPPAIGAGVDLARYMVTDFVESVRACLGDGGFKRTNDGVESGGAFLVGIRGRLFCIESDFQVGEGQNDFAAVGCGADIALGSLYSTYSLGDPAKRLDLALTAACEFSAGVAAPFCFADTMSGCEVSP